MFEPQPQSELIGKKFHVQLLNQKEYRGASEEIATIMKIDSGLFLFHFERDQKKLWVPLTQITSLSEITDASSPPTT